MRTRQIIDGLRQGKTEGKEFIKWWRKENDFSDYELLDNFLNNQEMPGEIENYELLDNEQMWEVLKRYSHSGLRRNRSNKSDQIEWRQQTQMGQKLYTCPYNAHNIMSIFNAETKDTTVC